MLLVESDPLAPSVRHQLRHRLKVSVVTSAQAAFEALRVQSFAAVLVGAGLGDRPGLELAARLKLEHPGLLVALLAGELDTESMLTASALGIQVADRADLPVLADLLASFAAG